MRHVRYVFTILLVGLAAMTACSAAIQPAPVAEVSVESRDGVYIAVVEGELPDACAQIGAAAQRVDGDTVRVGILLQPPPPEMMCAQMVAPYTEEIVLDTSGLPPGDYQVIVNNVPAPFRIEPEPQAEPEMRLAPVASVEIDQRADGNVLIIAGEMPDPCHEVGEISQRVESDEIVVTVEMTPPAEDMMCAQVMTPYSVEVRIDATLEPGEYTVTVNDKTVDVTVN